MVCLHSDTFTATRAAVITPQNTIVAASTVLSTDGASFSRIQSTANALLPMPYHTSGHFCGSEQKSGQTGD